MPVNSSHTGEVSERFKAGMDNCQMGQPHLALVATVSALVTGVPPVSWLHMLMGERMMKIIFQRVMLGTLSCLLNE